jgi:2C-methyl-D-erythritol 2,4-cyclodiphosphate synthase
MLSLTQLQKQFSAHVVLETLVNTSPIPIQNTKIAPHRDEMQKILSLAAGAPVTVKGRRAEGLGAIGRVEGIACWAVAIVTQSK